jgi:hypothetical protein
LGGISSSIRCPQSDRDAGLVWKHFPSKPIKEFFKDWEKKYTSLEWIPIQDKNGRETGEIFSQKRVGTASKDIAVSLLAFTGDLQKECANTAEGDSKDIHGLWLGKYRFPEGRVQEGFE